MEGLIEGKRPWTRFELFDLKNQDRMHRQTGLRCVSAVQGQPPKVDGAP